MAFLSHCTLDRGLLALPSCAALPPPYPSTGNSCRGVRLDPRREAGTALPIRQRTTLISMSAEETGTRLN